MTKIKPSIEDAFFNTTLEVMGIISRLYISPWTGLAVLDVAYPGTDFESETYAVNEVIFHKGDKERDACFMKIKGAKGYKAPKKETFIYIETKRPGRGIRQGGAWEKVINLPLSQEVAEAVCKLLQAEHSDKHFQTSIGKPSSYNF